MLKNNLNTTCPTYEEINVLFPDTTEPRVSGGFVEDNGFYHRENTKMKSHYEYYRYNEKPTTWIDPPGDVIEKMPRIFIEAGDFEYKINQQKITNSSYIVGNNRYVSSSCTYIIISSANWYFLLGDSINHLLHDCSEDSTNFDEIKIKRWEATTHDITTSAKYQLDKWIKESKEKSKHYLIPK